MALLNNREPVKEIPYSYNDDSKGSIEVNFRVKEPGEYKIVITEKDLKTMGNLSLIGKILGGL